MEAMLRMLGSIQSPIGAHGRSRRRAAPPASIQLRRVARARTHRTLGQRHPTMAQGEAPAAGDHPGSAPRLAGALQDQTRTIHPRARTRRRRRGVVDRARGFFGASPATTGRGRGLERQHGVDFFGAEDRCTERTARMRDSAVEAEGRKPRNKGWVRRRRRGCMTAHTRLSPARRGIPTTATEAPATRASAARRVIGGEVRELGVCHSHIY